MKAYTDIEQSKKLAKILPIESADMCISLLTIITNGNKEIKQVLIPVTYSNVTAYPVPDFIERFPVWSLAALLNVIPIWYDIHPTKSHVAISCDYGKEVAVISDNLVDACVEMILKLHELNLL